MATKKFNKEQLSRGKSILNLDDDFNPDEFTYDVISDFEKNPRKEDLPKVVEVIKNDSQLPASRKRLLSPGLKRIFSNSSDLKTFLMIMNLSKMSPNFLRIWLITVFSVLL